MRSALANAEEKLNRAKGDSKKANAKTVRDTAKEAFEEYCVGFEELWLNHCSSTWNKQQAKSSHKWKPSSPILLPLPQDFSCLKSWLLVTIMIDFFTSEMLWIDILKVNTPFYILRNLDKLTLLLFNYFITHFKHHHYFFQSISDITLANQEALLDIQSLALRLDKNPLW